MPIIQATNLSKHFRLDEKCPGLTGAFHHPIRPRFKGFVAVDDVSLQIESGESVSYGDPNGAVKSTTV